MSRGDCPSLRVPSTDEVDGEARLESYVDARHLSDKRLGRVEVSRPLMPRTRHFSPSKYNDSSTTTRPKGAHRDVATCDLTPNALWRSSSQVLPRDQSCRT